MLKSESGNAVVAVLVVLVVAALGVVAFVGGYINVGGKGKTDAAVAESMAEPASGDESKLSEKAPAEGEAQASQKEAAEFVVKPGNPVVAKIDGQDVTRLDVFNFIQTLPPNTRQLPVQQLFPLATEQVLNARLINEKTESVKLDNDPEVKKQLEEAKKQIVRSVFIQKQIDEKLTEDRVKAAYAQYRANFPDVDEAKARHILVKDEKLANDLIKQLNDGASFEELAKANSTDSTGANGGELGYFAKTDVVPEFSEAAFSMKPGEYSKKPVKSEFGYHVIKLEELRKRPPAELAEAKPFIEAQLRQQILNEIVEGWREKAKIERFDINGDPIEPAAGGDEPADKPADKPTK